MIGPGTFSWVLSGLRVQLIDQPMHICDDRLALRARRSIPRRMRRGARASSFSITLPSLMDVRFAGVAIAIFIVLASEPSFSQPPLTGSQQRVVTWVRRLVALPHLEPNAVSRAVGRRLRLTERSGDSRQDYELADDKDRVVGKIEVRWIAKAERGFLVMELEPDGVLSRDQIQTTFTDLEFKVVMPSTDIHAPPELRGSLVVYGAARMDVRFNCPDQTPGRCNHISLDEFAR